MTEFPQAVRRPKEVFINEVYYLVPSNHDGRDPYVANLDDRVIVEELQPGFGLLNVRIRHLNGSFRGELWDVSVYRLVELA